MMFYVNFTKSLKYFFDLLSLEVAWKLQQKKAVLYNSRSQCTLNGCSVVELVELRPPLTTADERQRHGIQMIDFSILL